MKHPGQLKALRHTVSYCIEILTLKVHTLLVAALLHKSLFIHEYQSFLTCRVELCGI
jgi:hypothetical protein